MRLQSNISHALPTLFLLLRTAASFQPALPSAATIATTTATMRWRKGSRGRVLFSMEPQRLDDDDEPALGGVEPLEPLPIADTSLPKLQIPKLSMPKFEIDFKEELKKIGVVVATVIAFVVIQKVGLLVSGIVTPELSPEDIAKFELKY